MAKCNKCGSTEHHTSECPHYIGSTECGKCGSKNHATSDCPHYFMDYACAKCGSKDHATRDCPHSFMDLECSHCGSKNHATSDCPHNIGSTECGKCGSKNHATGDCPNSWLNKGDEDCNLEGTVDEQLKSSESISDTETSNSSESDYDHDLTPTGESKGLFGGLAAVALGLLLIGSCTIGTINSCNAPKNHKQSYTKKTSYSKPPTAKVWKKYQGITYRFTNKKNLEVKINKNTLSKIGGRLDWHNFGMRYPCYEALVPPGYITLKLDNSVPDTYCNGKTRTFWETPYQKHKRIFSR